MLRITLNRATIELLHNLGEPLEFCNEMGEMLGTFTPKARVLAEAGVTTERRPNPLHPERHEELGEEMNAFGYEADIE
jgi:hypothetical protein